MNVNISEMSIDDYDGALQLWKKVEGIRLRPMDSKKNIQLYLERNPGLSFTAKHDNTLVGVIICGHDGRRAVLQHLAVLPDFRNQGIGGNLVKHACAALKKAGIQLCHIYVLNDNDKAINFWAEQGWKERRDIKMMSKNLSE